MELIKSLKCQLYSFYTKNQVIEDNNPDLEYFCATIENAFLKGLKYGEFFNFHPNDQ